MIDRDRGGSACPRLWAVAACWMVLADIGLAATYYVDRNHASANDSNPGTQAAPWRTIQKGATTAVAGDTVLVRSGTYSEVITVSRSGTAGNLITFKGYPGDPMPVMDGQGTRKTAWTVDYLNYIRIEGFEIKNYTGWGISAHGAGYGNGHQFIGNVIHDIGDGTIGDFSRGKGIGYGYGTGALIENNHIYNVYYTAITVGNCRDVTIRGNDLHDGEEDGISGGSDGVFLIENNKISRFLNVIEHGDGVQILGFRDTLIIRNNIFQDNTQNVFVEPYSTPIGTTPGGDAFIYGNVVYNSQYGANGIGGFGTGILIDHGYNNVRSAHVYNNVLIYLNGGYGGFGHHDRFDNFGVSYKLQSLYLKNNIFYNSIASPRLNIISGAVEIDGNTWWNPVRGWYMFGTNLTGIRQQYPQFEANGQEADPKFVNWPTLDVRLQSSSPAINRGLPLSPVGSVAFNFDFVGTGRPQGGGWDAGVYEYVSGPVPTASPSPTPTVSATPTASASPSPTSNSTITPTPSPTPTASSTPTVSQTPTLTASASPTPTASATPTSSQTPSPSQTPTPSATPTPVVTPDESGLVLALGFDEGKGLIAQDRSGLGNHGTLMNGPQWSNSGRFGLSLEFDGANDSVEVADHASLDLTTGMTLEAWVYPTASMSGWKTVITKERTSSNSAYFLAANSSNNVPAGGGHIGGTRTVSGTSQLPLNTWSHIAVTYNGSTQRIYVNGVQVASRNQTGSMSTTALPVRIGANALQGYFFAGRIDEVRIYNRALSLGEIQADMYRPINAQGGAQQGAGGGGASNAVEDWQWYD